MIIKYGFWDKIIDVTEICNRKLKRNKTIIIRDDDHWRASIFGDPFPDVVKFIFITDKFGNTIEYDHKKIIEIEENTGNIIVIDKSKLDEKLKSIHNSLKIEFGTFQDEYPEQIMALKFLTGKEKVLEIGGNIGRNSLVIASILKENGNTNFVTLECNKYISCQLKFNRDINDLIFHVESSALSKRNLIQKEWDTIESDTILEGYEKVNTITYDELLLKYKIDFDTLVLDCEGAFYYILKDMPEILKNIKLIIMENDYWDINNKNYIDNVLKENGFVVVYSKDGGWGPCSKNFFEVWEKYN